MFKKIALYTLAIFFIIAGLNHFRSPSFYLPMMPPYLPYHEFLILFSGVLEVLAGILLFVPKYRAWGAWLVILVLIGVFPANLYMYQTGGAGFGMEFSKIGLLLRLPAQLLLIGWAYIYTKPYKPSLKQEN